MAAGGYSARLRVDAMVREQARTTAAAGRAMVNRLMVLAGEKPDELACAAAAPSGKWLVEQGLSDEAELRRMALA